jgi:uncharacterized damage-inducible protein DinB
MAVLDRSFLPLTEGYRSPEVASFLAQLDELRARMFTDLEDITPAELEWQPRAGTNTIGMLLEHIAIVEVFWTQVGLQARPEADDAEAQAALGMGMDDDGMPIPENGGPPAVLAGKDLAFYRDQIERGREYLRAVAKSLGGSDLSGDIHRTRKDGTVRVYDRRWVLYHLVEHLAGHYGQILLLRHLFRAARTA